MDILIIRFLHITVIQNLPYKRRYQKDQSPLQPKTKINRRWLATTTALSSQPLYLQAAYWASHRRWESKVPT